MTHPRELIALITRLRKSGQPLKQVRLLLKLWQAVDEVPKKERGRLLRRLGLEGGEELIEKFLGGGGRLDPELAAGALQLLEGLSPKRVREFAGSHMSAAETEQVLEMLTGALRQQAGDAAAAEEESEEPVPSPPSSEPFVRRRRPIPLVDPPVDPDAEIEDVVEIASEVVDSALGAAGVAAAGVGVAAGAAAAAAAAGGDEESRESPDDEAGIEAAEPESDDAPKAAPEEDETGAPAAEAGPAAPEPVAPPQPAPAPAPEPEPTPLRPAVVAELPSDVRPAMDDSASPTPDWLEALQAVSTPTLRLLAYRRLEDRIDRLNRAQVRDLVDLFPPGWMRRRVLQSVFSKGLLSAGDAAGLLAEIEPTPVTYLWLAGSLLDRPDLRDSHRETLIEQAPSATIKRLLQARARA